MTDQSSSPMSVVPQFNEQERAAITELSERSGLSALGVMRQALRTYQLQERRAADGETISFSGDAKRAAEFYAPDVAEIVRELRSSEPLPACPFDKISPLYLTMPDDKPCPFCGQENTSEGPDKCRGADTRIMGRAADALERLSAVTAELKAIISRCATEIGNGAAVSPDCSIEFMAQLPAEIAAHTDKLRRFLKCARDEGGEALDRAAAAEARLAEALDGKAKAEHRLGMVEGGLVTLLIAAQRADPTKEIIFRIEEELRQIRRPLADEPFGRRVG